MIPRRAVTLGRALPLVLVFALLAGCERPETPSQVSVPSAAEAAPETSSATATAPTTANPTAAESKPPAAPSRPVQAVPVSVNKLGPAKDVTFDDIKLDLQKDEPYAPEKLTDKVKALSGQAIRIRGFILPSFQNSGIRQFVLVRDNMECCFGPGAALHDCILVEMVAPATASFTTRPVSVEGAFSVREVKGPDGKYLAIYHLDGTKVN